MDMVTMWLFCISYEGGIYMETRAIKIFSPMNKKIALKVIPGHFATSNSHINLYIDLTTMKTRLSEAAEAAKTMAKQYMVSTLVDTIVCLDGCEVIGAYLAQELTLSGIMSMNAHQTIYIVTPEFNTNGQMIFQENFLPMIYGKNIVLLAGSTTTGDTLKRSIECIKYYGGIMQGISSIFSAVDTVDGTKIHSIFQTKDLPNYESYSVEECPLCKTMHKLDAIVNGNGYIKL
jgi:orotate phosphoribosyltransferase